MRLQSSIQKTTCASVLLLLCLLPGRSAQFVDVTAEIEIYQWSSEHVQTPHILHFLIGTNGWQIEGDFLAGAKGTVWFTGTNIIENEELTSSPAGHLLNWTEGASGESSSYVQVATRTGQRWTSIHESTDGNPSRPVHQRDRLTLPGRIGWLAFCSGSFIKRPGRQIFPSSDLWKEIISAPTGFASRTKVFEDPLGLPRKLDLYTSNNQPVLQYRVLSSTNVLNWEFPLEFYLAQYGPAYRAESNDHSPNAWELDISAKGKVTAIGTGTQPKIPPEVIKTALK